MGLCIAFKATLVNASVKHEVSCRLTYSSRSRHVDIVKCGTTLVIGRAVMSTSVMRSVKCIVALASVCAIIWRLWSRRAHYAASPWLLSMPLWQQWIHGVWCVVSPWLPSPIGIDGRGKGCFYLLPFRPLPRTSHLLAFLAP